MESVRVYVDYEPKSAWKQLTTGKNREGFLINIAPKVEFGCTQHYNVKKGHSRPENILHCLWDMNGDNLQTFQSKYQRKNINRSGCMK